jgi:deferrochelatase/peroxidase EfeB
MNPRDATVIGIPRLHRMIRHSTSYGPMLPKGVLEDDGVDRGIIFVAAMAQLERQFEFVKTEWLNQGLFIGVPDDKDPLAGPNDGSDQFTIPQVPIRRRLTDVPAFVVNRGGEYFFVPSLSSMRWLSELDT